MKKIFSAVAFLALAIGCRGQVPPATTHVVNLAWTAPAPTVVNGVTTWPGCGTVAPQTPCNYGVYKCTGTPAQCADTTTNLWSEITTAATRPSVTAFVDTTAIGQVSYVVKTFQGTSSSGGSNVANVVVPGVPTAPALSSPTVAQETKPALPALDRADPHYELALNMKPLHLTARTN